MTTNSKLLILFCVIFFITVGSLTVILYSPDAEVLSSHTENIQPTSANSTVFGKLLYDFKQGLLEINLGSRKAQLAENFAKLEAEASKASGDFSIYVLDKSTGEEYLHNADEEYYAASLFKLIVTQATFTKVKSGALTLDTKLTLLNQDYTGGTGIINGSKAGSEFTLDYVIDRLLKDSDNTAQNMLLRYVSNNDLNKEFSKLPTAMSFLAENEASPIEVTQFFNILYPEVVAKMEETSFDNRINLGLSQNIVFSHKIGSWYDSWHDCGLAKKGEKEVLVCVMSDSTSLETFQAISKKVGEFVTKLLD